VDLATGVTFTLTKKVLLHPPNAFFIDDELNTYMYVYALVSLSEAKVNIFNSNVTYVEFMKGFGVDTLFSTFTERKFRLKVVKYHAR
jgi:hypothetical protein